MKNTIRNVLLTGIGLAAGAGIVKAEIPMADVIERVNRKGYIVFEDIASKDQAIEKAYGHFKPFDRVNVTKDGKLITLEGEVLERIIHPRSIAINDSVAVNLNALISKNEDFYVAGENGSFKIIREGQTVVGTTDAKPQTHIIDMHVDDTTGTYLKKVADMTDRVATEAYHIYNGDIADSISFTLKGRKSTVLGTLADRLGVAIGTNSSVKDMTQLSTEMGLQKAVSDALGGAGKLDRRSEVDVNLDVIHNTETESAILCVVNVKDKDGKLVESYQTNLFESHFWDNHEMNSPSEQIGVDSLDTYLGLISEPLAAGNNGHTDSTQVVVSDKTKVPVRTSRVSLPTNLTWNVNTLLGAYNGAGAGLDINFNNGFSAGARGALVFPNMNDLKTYTGSEGPAGSIRNLEDYRSEGMGLLLEAIVGRKLSQKEDLGVSFGAFLMHGSYDGTLNVDSKILRNNRVVNTEKDDPKQEKRSRTEYGATLNIDGLRKIGPGSVGIGGYAGNGGAGARLNYKWGDSKNNKGSKGGN